MILLPTYAAMAAGPRPPLLAVNLVQNPDPLIAFGKVYIVYELTLTSYDSSPIELSALRISDANNSRTTFSFSGPALADMVRPIDSGPPDEISAVRIETGQSRLVFIWLPFNAPAALPRIFVTSIQCRVKRQSSEAYDIDLAPVSVGTSAPISVGPPLRGGIWLAEGGPSNTSYHRRARMVVNGNLVSFPQ